MSRATSRSPRHVLVGTALLAALLAAMVPARMSGTAQQPADSRPRPAGPRGRALVVPDNHDEALQAATEIPGGQQRRVILQLTGAADRPRREALRRQGIRLLQYIDGNTWYATLNGGLDAAALTRGGVRATWRIEAADRLSPAVTSRSFPKHALRGDGSVALTVLAFADADMRALTSEIQAAGGMIRATIPAFSLLFVDMPVPLVDTLASIDGIHRVEPAAPTPKAEMSRALTYLGVDVVQAAPYSLTGAGVKVSVHEDGHVFAHPDFGTRLTTDPDPELAASHATAVAGTIGGAGAFNAQYKGAAPAVDLYSYAFGGDMAGRNYADIVDALSKGVDIANNSWGYPGCHPETDGLPYGDYSMPARVFDLQALGRDSQGNAIGSPMVVVFSAGNERDGWGENDVPDCVGLPAGTYPSPPFAYYGTLNQPKSAKNPIVVGAVDSSPYVRDRMTTFSSWGPTSDGRIKPDIVAAGVHYGTNVIGPLSGMDRCKGYPLGAPNQQCYRTTGTDDTDRPFNTFDDRFGWIGQTSAAAALTSGSAALFLEDFRAKNSGRNPLPSTVKAHFIHTARDLNDYTSWYNEGPDYASGYGVLQIKDAIDQARTKNWTEGVVDQGQSSTISIEVPADATTVKLTLAWDDEPGDPGTTTALVNDLDLIVIDPTGRRYYPWTLDPAQPAKPAVRNAEDHLNNVEVVYVKAGDIIVPGTWTITVRGTSVPAGPQSYSLVYSAPVVGGTADMTIPSITATGTFRAGSFISVADETKNDGPNTAAPSTTRFFWSTDATYSSEDIAIGERSVGALDPGSADVATTSVQIPASAAAGTYYVIAVADARGEIAENFETNNTNAAKVTLFPDLVITSLSVAGITAPGQTVTVFASTANIGNAESQSSTTRFYWSTDSRGGGLSVGTRAVPGLARGASDPPSGAAATSVTIPPGATPGVYYIVAVANDGGANPETLETNNSRAVRVVVGPDVTVSAVSFSGCIAPGATILIKDTTRNSGTTPINASTTTFYWSANAVLDSSDVYLGARPVPALAAGASDTPTTAGTPVTIPAGAPAGNSYIIAVADGVGAIAEMLEDNNAAAVVLPIAPDLVVSDIAMSGAVVRGASIVVADRTKNIGCMPAPPSTTRYYITADTLLTRITEYTLGSRVVPALAAGADSVGYASVTIPLSLTAGTHSIIAVADAASSVLEVSEANNRVVAVITVY